MCNSGASNDADNDGVCDVLDQCPSADDNLIGMSCDDGDICTIGETYDSQCNCSGGIFQDADTDGICDALDDDCVTVNFADFESDSGIWQSNGIDAAHISSPNSPNGNSSFRITDNSGLASSVTSSSLDLTVDQTVIKFNFQSKSFSVGEDFFLYISIDGGASFQPIRQWTNGTDFDNDIIYNEEVVLTDSQVSSTTMLRFTCDASINSDEVYLDNIRIQSCPLDCEAAIFQTTNSIITESESVMNIIETNGIVEIGPDIDFDAGQYILMEAGFEVKLGAVFHAFIDGCSN